MNSQPIVPPVFNQLPQHGPPATKPHLVALVGSGVVGRAILVDHVRAQIDTLLFDINEAAIQTGIAQAVAAVPDIRVARIPSPLAGLIAVRLTSQHPGASSSANSPQVLIESISENLELKQKFFEGAHQAFGLGCVLATNTSNLGVADIFMNLPAQAACVGLHFFMPVGQRPLVELIPRPTTPASALSLCQQLAARLHKQTLTTTDTPGFVVNRLLAPYLNQALLLLGRGASADLLQSAALRFGMPLSPLELVDLIGVRTAFDSGRVFWRSFPKRIDPAPILSGMIKAQRLGKEFNGGFFDYDPEIACNHSSPSLNPTAATVIQRYLRNETTWNETDLLEHLTIPMWIEAAEILAAGVVPTLASIELGMRGGLGHQLPEGFFGFFDTLGRDRMIHQINSCQGQAAMTPSSSLLNQLRQSVSPSAAIEAYCHQHRPAAPDLPPSFVPVSRTT